MTAIRQHDYIDGRCQHCGDKESDNVGEHAGRACVARELPRAVPVSVHADLGSIGDRLKEIQAEERTTETPKFSFGIDIEDARASINRAFFERPASILPGAVTYVSELEIILEANRSLWRAGRIMRRRGLIPVAPEPWKTE